METLFFKESPFLFIIWTVFCLILFMLWRKAVIGLVYLWILLSLCWFYRVPQRNFVKTDGLIAPSDGVVKQIIPLKNGRIRIVTFLNIFNQHIQYYPVSGTIQSVEYKKGRFHPAYLLEKSQYNERSITTIVGDEGQVIRLTQIAGQVARRIVNRSLIGTRVQQGQLLGMIKLSSRVDLEFSTEHYSVNVKVGDSLSALETIIATKR
jgi:phosphatidylserine decarboxylase